MNRRDFVGLISTAIAFSSLTANAEGRRRVAVLMLYSDRDPPGHARLSIFKDSLEKLGWRDGSNVDIEVRWCGAEACALMDL
jgi:hypothetical protein